MSTCRSPGEEDPYLCEDQEEDGAKSATASRQSLIAQCSPQRGQGLDILCPHTLGDHFRMQYRQGGRETVSCSVEGPIESKLPGYFHEKAAIDPQIVSWVFDLQVSDEVAGDPGCCRVLHRGSKQGCCWRLTPWSCAVLGWRAFEDILFLPGTDARNFESLAPAALWFGFVALSVSQ